MGSLTVQRTAVKLYAEITCSFCFKKTVTERFIDLLQVFS